MRGLPVDVKINLQKARESALLAVDIYNKPATSFRSCGYVVMMVIAWTSLLHAIFKRNKINYYYRKKDSDRYEYVDGEKKAWNLETSIGKYIENGNDPVLKNIEFFIHLRNKIEHRFLPELDFRIFGECQALLLNFEDILYKEFGDKYALKESLPISLQLSRESHITKEKAQKKDMLEVMKFIDKYRGELKQEIWDDPKFSYRVFLFPKIVNNPKTADVAIEFINYDSTKPEEMEKYKRAVMFFKEKYIPVSNLDKYKPWVIVEEVKKKIPDFTMGTHTKAWKYYKVRPNGKSSQPEKCKSEYSCYDKPHDDYVYTKAWIDFLVKKLSDKKEMKKVKKFSI